MGEERKKSLPEAIRAGLVTKEEADSALKHLRNGAENGGRIISFANWNGEDDPMIASHNQAICALEEIECGYAQYSTRVAVAEREAAMTPKRIIHGEVPAQYSTGKGN